MEKNSMYDGITPSKWISTTGKKYYKYSDFVIVDENNKIILDDRICYLNKKFRSDFYLNDYRKTIRGTEILNVEINYVNNKTVVIMTISKKN